MRILQFSEQNSIWVIVQLKAPSEAIWGTFVELENAKKIGIEILARVDRMRKHAHLGTFGALCPPCPGQPS
jgi:hypothetical protein